MIIGLYHGSTSLIASNDTNHLFHQIPKQQEATLSGTLITSPSTASDKTNLLFAVDSLMLPRNLYPLQRGEEIDFQSENHPLKAYKSKGRIKLAMKGVPPDNIKPGDRLLIRATISRPYRYGTPGSFDYPKFLARKSISATGWIQSSAHILKLRDQPKTLSHFIRYWPENIRYKVNKFLSDRLPERNAGIYKAILTGDKFSVPNDTLENFKATGTMHLLAISGLHMGLLALSIGFILNWTIKRSCWLMLHIQAWKFAALLTLPVLFFYALIAGFQTPVIRALIMTCVFLFAVAFDRQWHVYTNIAIAAMFILLIHPLSLFTASFQLSFAAVIGIALILPKIKKIVTPECGKNNLYPPLKTKLLRWMTASLMLSCVATLSTLPLLIFYFNRISLMSPISTLIIEPLLCFWSLLIGLVSCPFIFLAPDVANFLLHLGSLGIQWTEHIIKWLSLIPFSSLRLSTPSIFEIILYYIFIISILLFTRNPLAKFLCLCCFAGLIAIPAYAKISNSTQNYQSVSFLDVGHGNCTVVESSNGDIILIDGGGTGSEKFNVGEMIIAPYLWEKRVKKVKHIIISHSDSDHYNGIRFVLRHFSPDTLWVNSNGKNDKEFQELLNEAKRYNVKIRIPEIGETIFSHDTLRIENIAGLHLKEDGGKDNNKSLVIKVSYGEVSFLLTGDIEKIAEQELIRHRSNLQADILLAPHHGSSTSSSNSFLDKVSPDYIVISAGKFKKTRFPAPEIFERYKKLGTVFNTATEGTVTFKLTDNQLAVETFISKNQAEIPPGKI